jgi:tRNA(Arg) A34 adenosine deaminase TadA
MAGKKKSGKSKKKPDHERFMRRALELSAHAALEYSTGGAFGAVIVRTAGSSPRG